MVGSLFTIRSLDIDLDVSPAACLAEIGQIPSHESGNEDGDANKYRQMFKLRVLHLMAFFILIYVGVEVTLGGAK